jgi:hypothetical protein
VTAMPVLKVLLQHRHLQTHRSFCREYDKVATGIDPTLRGSWPSKAQFYRWLAGNLVRLPYPDHCRILEGMFPGWKVDQLFQAHHGGIQFVPEPSKPSAATPTARPTERQTATVPPQGSESTLSTSTNREVRLLASGAELGAALVDVVRGAQECLIAVGSRSSEPHYLQEIERAITSRPQLIHYRILIGPPHSQVLKDHLLRLLELQDSQAESNGTKRLHVGLHMDLERYYERFFVANEKEAATVLPSMTSPMNFDTGLLIRDPSYVQGLLQHGKALYGKHRLESADAVRELEVLG